jgi:cell division protein ZapA (FtsZ GTPase activity inhibitor)
MENNEIILLVKIFIGVAIFVILALQYVEGKIKQRHNRELEENMNKHITRTGGLENDRINERP